MAGNNLLIFIQYLSPLTQLHITCDWAIWIYLMACANILESKVVNNKLVYHNYQI